MAEAVAMEIAEFAKRWTSPLPGSTEPMRIDEGAVFHLAWYMHDQLPVTEWRREADRLVPQIRAVLQHAGADELDAHRRACRIAINAMCDAQELRDNDASLKTFQSSWLKSHPGDALQRAASPAKKTNGAVAAKVEHISAVSLRVIAATEHEQRTLPTPFPTLNYLLNGGFWPGEYTLLGARPSIGKSALATQFALCVARRAHGTLIVSREMRNEAVVRRMLSQNGKLDAGRIRSGRNVDARSLTASADKLHGMPIWLTDCAHSPEVIAATVDQLADKIGFCVVDYLQLLDGPKHIREHRLQIEAISKALKNLATTRNIPVLALSSLSRPAQGQEKRPTLASLRETAALEHDADVVLLLHRERERNETECIVAKNRDGCVGTAELMFRPEWVGFDEITHDTQFPSADPPPRRWGNANSDN